MSAGADHHYFGFDSTAAEVVAGVDRFELFKRAESSGGDGGRGLAAPIPTTAIAVALAGLAVLGST